MAGCEPGHVATACPVLLTLAGVIALLGFIVAIIASDGPVAPHGFGFDTRSYWGYPRIRCIRVPGPTMATGCTGTRRPSCP